MATWRRLALEQFPELHAELTRPHEIDSVYELWSTLLPMAMDAHARHDTDLLRRIYGYAHWSARHPSEHLWNPVAVSFLEALLDNEASEERMDKVLEWLADDVVADAWGPWESRGVDLKTAARLLRTRRRPVPTGWP